MKSKIIYFTFIFFFASASYSADHSFKCKLTTDADIEISFDLNAKELTLHNQHRLISSDPYEVERGNAILDNVGLKGGKGKMQDRLVFMVNYEKSEVVSETTGELYIQKSLLDGVDGGYVSFIGHGYSYESYVCSLQTLNTIPQKPESSAKSTESCGKIKDIEAIKITYPEFYQGVNYLTNLEPAQLHITEESQLLCTTYTEANPLYTESLKPLVLEAANAGLDSFEDEGLEMDIIEPRGGLTYNVDRKLDIDGSTAILSVSANFDVTASSEEIFENVTCNIILVKLHNSKDGAKRNESEWKALPAICDGLPF